MGYLVLILGFLALIPVYFFVKDRFFEKGRKVDVDIKNTFLVPFQCEDHELNGAMGIGFYDMKITNTSNYAFTIKKITLEYELDGKMFETDSFAIKTGQLPDGREAAMLSNDIDNIILMGWFNLSGVIRKHQSLLQGGVIKSSAYFVLEGDKEQHDRMEDVKLVIYDYRDKKSTHKLQIPANWKDRHRQGFKMLNLRFNVDKNSKVHLAQQLG